MTNLGKKAEIIEFAKEKILRSKENLRDIENSLISRGYSEEFSRDIVGEAYRGISTEIFPKIKINPYNINRNQRVEFDKTAKFEDTGGSVGLAKLLYSGKNPFIQKEVKGFSFHDEEGQMRRFVYLSYYQNEAKKLKPSRSSIKHYDRDYELAYRAGEIEKALEKTGQMHEKTDGGDFEIFIEDKTNDHSHRVLKKIMKGILNNCQNRPFIIKNHKDFLLTLPLEDGRWIY
jgi:hypothetical protein